MLVLLSLLACPTPKDAAADDTAALCPAMACADQVTFFLFDAHDDPWTSAFQGYAELADDTIVTFDCPGGGGEGYACGEDSVIVYTGDATVYLNVTAGDFYAAGVVSPEYVDQLPGGEACGVYCRQATEFVVLQLDAC